MKIKVAITLGFLICLFAACGKVSNEENKEIFAESSTPSVTEVIEVEETPKEYPAALEKIDFEENYIESIESIDLTDVLVNEEVHTFLGIYEDDLYYISYGEVGLDVYCVESFTDSPQVKKIYSCDEGRIWYFCRLYEDKIYIEVTSEEWYSTLLEIGIDGTCKTIYTLDDNIWNPIIYEVPGYLMINHQRDNKCLLDVINLENPNPMHTVRETELIQNEDGTYTGEYILYGGGSENQGFYYEVVSLENEYLNKGTNSEIYYYDLEKEENRYVLKPSNKSVFLSGTEQYVFRCCYGSPVAYQISGRICWNDGEEKLDYGIPGVSTGNDLRKVEVYDDSKFLGITHDNLVMVDVENFTTACYELEGENLERTLGYYVSGKHYYIVKNEDAVVLKVVTLKDVG